MRELLTNTYFLANPKTMDIREKVKIEILLESDPLDAKKDKLKVFLDRYEWLKKLDFLIQQNLHSSPLELISDSGNLQLALRRLIDKSAKPLFNSASIFLEEFKIDRPKNDHDLIDLTILFNQLELTLLRLNALNKAVEESSWQSYIDHIQKYLEKKAKNTSNSESMD